MKADLERAVGLALGAQAEYLLMASEAEDKQAKQVFDSMAEDLDRHVKVLRSRQEYLQKWGTQLQQQQAMAQQAAMGAQGGMQQGMMAQPAMQQQMAQQPNAQQMAQQPNAQQMAQQPNAQQTGQQPNARQSSQGGAQDGADVGSSGAGGTTSGGKG